MRKTLTALLAAATIGAVALPNSAEARWGWGWGGFGVGLGTGLLLGAATAPYYGGYYGYGPYPYGYGPYYAAYGGGPYGYNSCYIRGRWVWDGYGHRVWRRFRVCY